MDYKIEIQISISKCEENKNHIYTDEECIKHCYYIGCYGGHSCLIQLDKSYEQEYRRILKEQGRKGLWDYGVKKGFFKKNTPEYYGFFGENN